MEVSVNEVPGEGEIDVHHFVHLAGDAVIGGYAIVVRPEQAGERRSGRRLAGSIREP